MPTSLTATKIKDTYGQLLHVDGGVTSTLKTVYDGDGTATALSISTTSIAGNLTGNVTGDVSGNAGTVTNGVYTTGDQTIGGTKTFSSNPVYSAGTANGVAYLNGSKVLTTGSALTFDGTTLLVGTANEVNKLTLSGTAGFNGTGISLFETSTGNNARLRMYQASGVASYDATFGTGGNAQAWLIGGSEQMRLTSTGLGIGTSSPRAILDLNASRAVKAYWGTSGTLGETQSSAGDYIANNLYVSAEYAGTMTYTKTTEDSGNAIIQDFSRGITFYTGVTGAATTTGTLNSFERMRIDSSGNVGIGTSSPAYRLDVRKAGETTIGVVNTTHSISTLIGSATDTAYIGTFTNHPQTFYTNSTERMRIDSSGNLLVGTTGNPIANCRFRAAATGDWSFGPYQGGTEFLIFNTSSVGVYLSNGSQSWTGSSDERLKTDLLPIENAVDKVSTLRSVTGRFKTDEEGVSRSFLIAQDMLKVFPEAVDVREDEQGTLGIRYTDTIPLLVAAIKELKAELDATKAEVAALKAKQ